MRWYLPYSVDPANLESSWLAVVPTIFPYGIDTWTVEEGIEKENLWSLLFQQMGVSKNRCTPKSSNLMGLSIINSPSILGYPYGTPIFGNTQIDQYMFQMLI